MNQAVIGEPSYRRFLARMDALRSAGVLLGLDRMRLALERLGHPEHGVAFVQIAGTNGKGSTAAMVESIARAAGLKTALYTSPHLVRFTERLRFNGVEVEPHLLEPALDRVLATAVPLTYFEAATLVAVCLIASARVDLAIMETGLGGRLDAVTALPAVATAITSISADHLDLLGPTLLHVAREKAAIARTGVPLFVPRLPPQLAAEVQDVARSCGAAVSIVDPVITSVGLLGAHQHRNAGLALALARTALATSGRKLAPAHVALGLTRVRWPGRLEQIGQVLLDCAHNPEGAEALAMELNSRAERPRVLVVSIVAGKDVGAILGSLREQVESIVVTKCASDRALPPAALAAALPLEGPAVAVVEDPEQALEHACSLAGDNGLAVVAGSVFLVGQLRALLLGEPRDPITTSDPLPQPADGRGRPP